MMCLGTPMQVEQVLAGAANCRDRDRLCEVDTRLVGGVAPGQWLLVCAGVAYECIDEQRAAEISDALRALEAALNGRFDPDAYFRDLTGREPSLPEHLRKS